MADDIIHSDTCSESIPSISDTPFLVLHQSNQHLSNSFSSPNEVCDSKKSSFLVSLSSPGKGSQQPDCNQELLCPCVRENALLCHLDVSSVDCSRKSSDLVVQDEEIEENQEKLGSCVAENDTSCDLISLCDFNSESCSRKVGDFDVHLQEASNFASVVEDNQGESEGAIKDAKCEVGLSEVQEFEDSAVLEEPKINEDENETLLEAKKRQLLAKVEAGSIFKDKHNLEYSLGYDTATEILEGLRGMDESLKCSLKVEVIDDTAVVCAVPSVVTCNVDVNNADKNIIKQNEKQGSDGKKGKRPRRKGKDVNKSLEISDKQKKTIRISRSHSGALKYSREEMEALRFVNIVEQRKLWKSIYSDLPQPVKKEYADLANSRKHQKNVQHQTRFGRNGDTSGILGDVCCKNTDELDSMEDGEVENVNLSDPGCGDNIIGEDAHVEVETNEDEGTDDDYSSIQRPAFLVEGEPDFSSGPPQDGLEYLRRVRWEAAHIPKVKVAKLDRSKVNKEQSVYMPQIPEIAKCSEHLLPMKQWEDAFLSDFSELRKYLSHHADSGAEISCKLQSVAVTQEPNNSSLQLDEDTLSRANGHHSCELLSESCSKGATDQASENIIPAAECDCSGNYPKLSSILSMDAVARISMLRKRISLAETMNTLSKDNCMWLFSLCAAVDTPLDANACASLRSLLRKCASMRAAKSELDDEVIMLNILITIAGRYFRQSEI